MKNKIQVLAGTGMQVLDMINVQLERRIHWLIEDNWNHTINWEANAFYDVIKINWG